MKSANFVPRDVVRFADIQKEWERIFHSRKRLAYQLLLKGNFCKILLF